MRRTRTLGGIALATALLAGCEANFNAPDWPEGPRWPGWDDEVTVTWQWTGQVDAGQYVEVKTVFGDISGVPAAGNEVVVKATKIGRAGAVDLVHIDVIPHPSGVTICAVYPDVPGHQPNSCVPGAGGNMTVWDGGQGVVRVNFVVQVPDGVDLIARTLW